MFGKRIRLKRLFDKASERIVIVPMDHGAYMGPISGIDDIKETILAAYKGGADAILINPGIIRFIPEEILGDIGLILRVTNTHIKSESFPYETTITTVLNSIAMGIDAVAFTVNVGGVDDLNGIREFGMINDECNDHGIPLLGEFLPAGSKMKDPYDVNNVKYVTRIAAELGADIIKTNYTGSAESFKEVTSTALVPVVIAGGEKMGTTEDILKIIKGSIDGGGKGCCIGRNIWQRKNPLKTVQAVCKIVHEGVNVEEAKKAI